MQSLKRFQKDFQLIEDNDQKTKVVFQKLTQWSKVNFLMRTRSKKDIEAIIKTIDMPQFKNIKEKYKDIPPEAEYKNKYLDLYRFLPINLKRIYTLNLHKTEPLNILDIGAGPGYFCYISNYFGHNATAMDLGDNPVYNDLIPCLNIERQIWQIEAFEKLPALEKKFDLITAFLICFNKRVNQRVVDPDFTWRSDEWEFFLRDLANNQLKENGQVFLQLNPEEDGKHYDKSLLNFFLAKGAEVSGREVYFKSMDIFRA